MELECGEKQMGKGGPKRCSLFGSEVPWELALFTAVEGWMVEKGAGGAAPLRPLILLLVCDGLHTLTARLCREEEQTHGTTDRMIYCCGCGG